MSRKSRKLESPIEEMLFNALVKLGIEPELQQDVGSYRVDFMYLNEKLIVEADGFSYHDRNKTQFEYERQRERYLNRQGYTVIRFAGTEIYRDADSCAREVKMLLAGGEDTELQEGTGLQEGVKRCVRCMQEVSVKKRMFMFEDTAFGEGEEIKICDECESLPSLLLDAVLSKQFKRKGEVWR